MTADIILVLVLAGGFIVGFFRGLVRQALAAAHLQRALEESSVARLVSDLVIRPLAIILGPLLPPTVRSVMV